MALLGHTYKEIQRKVRSCIIEEGMTAEECVQKIEQEYELEEDDRFEIREMAKEIGKF
jgi:hypothetical protein